MKKPKTVSRIEEEIALLPSEDLLELLDGIVRRLKTSMEIRPSHNWDKLYGAGKGLWEEDAQEYVERMRQDR
jgi:hypothetical protein